MRLVSWNVNGLRACAEKGFGQSVAALDADCVCLQEIKLRPEQFVNPLEGYEAYLNTAPASGCITSEVNGEVVRTGAPWHSLSLFCPWHTSVTGDGNMLDYMLLYNLYRLVYE